jgi:hypothetical protein
MKVNAWKTVDIECEVEVSLDDCINELLDNANEEGMRSQKLQAIDGATKILEKITPEMMNDAILTRRSKEIVRGRIQKWIDAT